MKKLGGNRLENKIDLECLVDDHGDYLFRFAIAKVRDATLAQDLLQETYLAALKSADSYGGKSTERTWLTSILKNKIADYYRKYGNEIAFDAADLEMLNTERFFSRSDGWGGFWNKRFRPARWNTSPYKILENKDFYMVLDQCLSDLPAKVEQVFRLREVQGTASKEVREAFELSSSNYWIIMHRARLSLRSCMELNWFRTD